MHPIPAVGAPEAIVYDASGEQTSCEVKQFLDSIGTALRVHEEGTLWANRAEQYIGIIKAAVCKDILDLDSPLALWNSCVERQACVNNISADNLFNLKAVILITTFVMKKAMSPTCVNLDSMSGSILEILIRFLCTPNFLVEAWAR